MSADRQVYHLKVDSSGRIVLPAEGRASGITSLKAIPSS
jgi:hypothetical protein